MAEGTQANGSSTKELSVRIPVSEWMRLDQIAMEESEPGNRNSVSDAARDAIRRYLEEDEVEGVENRDVADRGKL